MHCSSCLRFSMMYRRYTNLPHVFFDEFPWQIACELDKRSNENTDFSLGN